MVYLTQDTQNRPHGKSPFLKYFLPDIWVKLVGYISDRVLVAPMDIGSTLLVGMWSYGCFIRVVVCTFFLYLLGTACTDQ